MRESAILGILGITTLGYYIDNAIANDHLDTALILIIITALLNMSVDTCSQAIRKHLKITASSDVFITLSLVIRSALNFIR